MARFSIIEDDPYISDEIAYWLREWKHEVTEYGSASEVLEGLQKIAWSDGVLLDLSLDSEELFDVPEGGFTGKELYRRIKDENPGVPFLIISAYPEFAENFAKQTGLPLMLKPFDKEILRREVESL